MFVPNKCTFGQSKHLKLALKASLEQVDLVNKKDKLNCYTGKPRI